MANPTFCPSPSRDFQAGTSKQGYTVGRRGVVPRRPAVSLRCHGSELRRRIPAVPWTCRTMRCAAVLCAWNASSPPSHALLCCASGQTSPWWPVAPSLPSPLGCKSGREDMKKPERTVTVSIIQDECSGARCQCEPHFYVGSRVNFLGQPWLDRAHPGLQGPSHCPGLLPQTTEALL